MHLRNLTVLTLALALVGRAPAWSADVFVATAAADFGTGSAAMMRADAAQAEVNLINLHSDAAVHYDEGRIYVINRAGQDNILILDPAAPGVPVHQYSVGNGSNPQDMVVLGPDRAYVTLYERDYVLVVHPATGAEVKRIDLSAFADADGLPELASMVHVGDRVYVAVQRLDRDAFWGPTGDSYIAIIDTATDTLIDPDPATPGIPGLRLASTNPGAMAAVGHLLYVQQVGTYLDLDGGVEVIDTRTLSSRGLVITEEQLGGQCGGLAMASATQGYTTASVWPTYAVVPFDPEAGTTAAPLAGNSGGYVPSLAVDGTRLLVADRGTSDDLNAAGVLVYDTKTGALLAGPIGTGLPPNSIVVLSEPPMVSAITDAAAVQPRTARLGAAYPNPFNATTLIPLALDAATATAQLTVRDALGRHVRTLHSGTMPVGTAAVAWDGRDDAGRMVGNGLYVVRLTAAGRTLATKVTLLK